MVRDRVGVELIVKGLQFLEFSPSLAQAVFIAADVEAVGSGHRVGIVGYAKAVGDRRRAVHEQRRTGRAVSERDLMPGVGRPMNAGGEVRRSGGICLGKKAESGAVAAHEQAPPAVGRALVTDLEK